MEGKIHQTAFILLFVHHLMFFPVIFISFTAIKVPFNSSLTETEPFYDEAGKFVENVEMMSQMERFPIAFMPELSSKILELPYGAENRLCMLLVLPNQGVHLCEVLDKLMHFSIDTISRELHKFDHDENEQVDVAVKLPRFKISSDFRLNSLLEVMGIREMFGQKANLSKISGNDTLYVSNVFHKAVIEVNEEGTVAAAAAGATVIDKTLPHSFDCNRPFGFLIIERKTNTLLFSGQVRRPNQPDA